MISGSMHVIKRDGGMESVSFDKILSRMRQSCDEPGSRLLSGVDPTEVVKQVIASLVNGIRTSDLDQEAARLCALRADEHLDYLELAARIVNSNHEKNTVLYGNTFVERMVHLAEFQIVDPHWVESVKGREQDIDSLQRAIRFQCDYFGFKTLERSYLLKRPSGQIVERPSDMMMRVATFLYSAQTEWDQVVDCYRRMCSREFIHASPTLFNSGTLHPQLLSCFLGGIDDSIDGIFNGLHQCARISKFAGGIGIHLHDIRGKQALIRGTNGKSDGIVPMLRVFNETGRYINQGGKRNGSIAVFLETHHPDIMEFLEMKRNTGLESERARQLFYGVWVSDLFMRRVEQDQQWSLFDPSSTQYELANLHGAQYEQRYLELEREGRAVQTLPARALWKSLLISQMETGVPYLGFKDHVNAKSAHQHLGVVRSSNLCMEIVEYSDATEWACCTLASLALPTFGSSASSATRFDWDRFHQAVRRVVQNLNRIVDKNEYPIPATRLSNMRHRPLGIGVQGLADLFAMWQIPFDSEEARHWNKVIFEALYFAAVTESVEQARLHGSFESYAGSTWSRGVLQCDMWANYRDRTNVCPHTGAPLFDWPSIRHLVQTVGIRNSMLTALMPTATTSQILGFNECFEPYTSQLYSRRTLAGDFVVVNQYLLRELMELQLWTPQLRQDLIEQRGSIQNIAIIPDALKARFKNVWEMKQSHLIHLSAERGPFIDQSQSLNLFLSGSTFAKLNSLHFMTWKLGLKTGMYYLRNRPASHMQQFGVTGTAPSLSPPAGPEEKKEEEEEEEEDKTCRRVRGADGRWTTDPTCESCSG